MKEPSESPSVNEHSQDISHGAVFPSYADIKDAICKYSHTNGFTVRSRDSRYDANKSIKFERIVCSCEGTSTSKVKNIVSTKNSIRSDCKWKVCIWRHEDKVQWTITTFNDEHNHELLRSELVDYRKREIPLEIQEHLKKLCDSNHDVSVSVLFNLLPTLCGEEVWNSSIFTKKDIQNFIYRYRRSRNSSIFSGADELIKDLICTRDRDPHFFFDFK